MKKNTKIIIILSIITLVLTVTYSYDKFKSFNLIGNIYKVFQLKENKPTYSLGENKILINKEFEKEYMTYLTEIYEQQNWTLKEKTKDKYKYCNEKECHIYNIYSNNIFTKKYVIIEKE